MIKISSDDQNNQQSEGPEFIYSEAYQNYIGKKEHIRPPPEQIGPSFRRIVKPRKIPRQKNRRDIILLSIFLSFFALFSILQLLNYSLEITLLISIICSIIVGLIASL